MVATQKIAKQTVIDQILTMLGNNLIDVDLSVDDVSTAINLAIDRYRQRSSNSTQESGFILTLQPDKQIYTLPEEITEVSAIYRRGLSAMSANTTSGQYDPFSLAYTNLYLLQPTGQGDLATFELYNQYLNVAAKMFGGIYDFRWDSRTHRLTIIRNQHVSEDVLIKAYNSVSDDLLLTGTYSKPWIRSYAMALSKMILGQAREMFGSVPGPTGSITLNGSQLKAEAVAEMAELDAAIDRYQDGGTPLGILIG